jgi:capsule polysaccharide export protein KpsE/RkpR
MWKAEQARKRKKFREWKNITTTSILQLVVVALIIVFYGVFASAIIADEKGSKVGVGGFVMAVSYTDSYDDLVYVSNFVNCDHAMKYYNDNCTDAKIMMCQQEEYLYMPIGHNSDSSFDFEPTDKQSCGFVGVQKPKFVEE